MGRLRPTGERSRKERSGTAAPTPCRHPRCGEPEWHHASEDGGFTDACMPFKLSAHECECRTPARYGTLPAKSCTACNGTGYLDARRKAVRRG